MPKLVAGSKLTEEQRREVGRSFVNRRLGGFATFADFVDTHAFFITKQGRLARRPLHCEPLYMLNQDEPQ